jgi:hypothetical protein
MESIDKSMIIVSEKSEDHLLANSKLMLESEGNLLTQGNENAIGIRKYSDSH